MNQFEMIPATEAYNDEICQLMAVPMKGKMYLSKKRDPDFFRGANVQNEFPETYLCRDVQNDKIAGLYSLGSRLLYVDGKLDKIRYASDLRVAQNYQGTGAFRCILDSFFSHDIQVTQTIVLANNKKMEELIDRVNQDQTLYHYVGKYNTYILPLSKGNKQRALQGKTIRQATSQDIPAMQLFFEQEAKRRQFYPYYDFQKLEDNYYYGLSISNYYLVFKQGAIIGMTGVWDQHSICKTLVIDYEKPLKKWRPLINLFNHKLLGGIRLPRIGEYLKSLFLHTLLIKDDDSLVFEQLLSVIHQEHAALYDNLVVGLAATAPLAGVLEKLKHKYVMPANYYLVDKRPKWENCYAATDFYFECARI